MKNEYKLNLIDIYFGYGTKQLFKNLNIDMDSGFISIIGPNGSGKSTLIKLMSGLLKSNSGYVNICGKEIKDISPNNRAKLFTIINQKQTFSFPFSCLELVCLSRYPYNRDFQSLNENDYNLVLNAMKDTDVIKFKDKNVTQLSGGEQQRVFLASAIAQDTEIIFLDEAFSALDICQKIKMIKLLLDRINKKNILVVAIMHDLNLAYNYSYKVCIMDKGQIIKFGTRDDVMTKSNIEAVFNVSVELIKGKGFIYKY